MVMLWNLVVLVGFVVERGGGQKAGHPTYNLLWSLHCAGGVFCNNASKLVGIASMILLACINLN